MRFNKLLLCLAVMTFAFSANANEVLQKYKASSERFIEYAFQGHGKPELLPLALELKGLGMQILDMYAKANPNCREQLDTMKAELSSLKETDLTKLFDRYHEAQGLPKGPYHCIYGRAYPLHPLMVEIRLHQGWTEENKKAGMADIEEMIKYLPNLEKNLTNPPN